MKEKIQSKMNRLYFYNRDLTKQEFQKSRIRLILSGPTASIINTLTAGSFFAGYLSYLGASQQYCAIMGAIPQLGCILQMLSPYLFERIRHRKLLICISCFLFRASVSSVILIPFLIDARGLRLTMIMMIYTFGYFMAGFVTPGLSHWYMSVAPESNRGKFLALKDIASMLSISAISVLVGIMLDYYKIEGRLLTGFSIMFGIALVMSVIDFILISHIEEPIQTREVTKVFLWSLIKTPICDKKYNKIILFLVPWNFAIQISVNFIPIYMLSSLGLSYTFISGISIVSNIMGMLAVFLWGHLADRTSWMCVLKLNGFIIALCYLGWFVVTPKNAVALVVVLQVTLTCCNGAFHMASNNIQYNLSSTVGKTAYLGVTSALSSVISFLGAILGAILNRRIKDIQIHILNCSISNFQILFLITGVLLFGALPIIRKLYSGFNESQRIGGK